MSAETETNYGKCLACGSVEVALDRVVGIRSSLSESGIYPVGYGCEVCS